MRFDNAISMGYVRTILARVQAIITDLEQLNRRAAHGRWRCYPADFTLRPTPLPLSEVSRFHIVSSGLRWIAGSVGFVCFLIVPIKMLMMKDDNKAFYAVGGLVAGLLIMALAVLNGFGLACRRVYVSDYNDQEMAVINYCRDFAGHLKYLVQFNDCDALSVKQAKNMTVGQLLRYFRKYQSVLLSLAALPPGLETQLHLMAGHSSVLRWCGQNQQPRLPEAAGDEEAKPDTTLDTVASPSRI